MLKSAIFREYDIRGTADTELLDADVEALGQAFGTYLQRHAGRKVNLGRDTRRQAEIAGVALDALGRDEFDGLDRLQRGAWLSRVEVQRGYMAGEGRGGGSVHSVYGVIVNRRQSGAKEEAYV